MLCEDAISGHIADLVGRSLCEPEITIRTRVSSSITPSIALAVNDEVFLVSLIADNFRVTIEHK